MPQFATSAHEPAFAVLEVDSFPSSAPAGTMGSVQWRHDGTAVILIRGDLPLQKKIWTLKRFADDLEKRLTPDGTGYWNGLKLVSKNEVHEFTKAGCIAVRPELSVVGS